MHRHRLAEQLEECEALLFDGYDEALIGIGGAFNQRVAVYDRRKILDKLISDGMSEEEAEEWVSFNVAGGYHGEKTPIIVDTCDCGQGGGDLRWNGRAGDD